MFSKSKRSMAHKLVWGVWGFRFEHLKNHCKIEGGEIDAYWHHYEDLVFDPSMVNEEDVCLRKPEENLAAILKLVQIVQENSSNSITDIKAAIALNQSKWLPNPSDDSAVAKALDLGVRLWLCLPLNYSEQSLTLEMAVASKLQRGRPQSGLLSLDFNAKNLMRKGGMTLRPTSDLSQHLVMEECTELIVYVFRHARLLKHFGQPEYSKIYPAGFLNEVQSTLQLLHPTAGVKEKKRTRQYVQEFDADFWTDVELGLQKLDQINLSAYPFFGERLAQIQKRYNSAVPRHFQQWWYDRRNRVEWATLVVAVVIFVLTVFFGIISSVTGILQVYASFKWH